MPLQISKSCGELRGQLLINAYACLQSVDVSRCENVTSSGLISVIEGHKYLQDLNIGDCFP